MRKPRDFDAALKALDAKAKQLRQRKVTQLGELVVATGADALAVEELVGALLAAVTGGDFVAKEDWANGAARSFRGRTGKAAAGAGGNPNSDPAANRSRSPLQARGAGKEGVGRANRRNPVTKWQTVCR